MLKRLVYRGFSHFREATMTFATNNEWKPRYFDIGVNFSDSMFQGCYNGSTTPKHPADIEQVIARAQLFNVNKMLITASSIKESEEHFDLCKEHPGMFYSTVGVHPCTVAQEFYQKDEKLNEYTEALVPDIENRLNKLRELVKLGYEKGYVKAFGEIGLDYDRFHYASKEQQTTMFTKQLEIISTLKDLKLPLFLHMRSACDDFISIIKPFIERGDILKGNGVVHSFTGTKEELEKLLNLGFYIGINGCSLKTDDNLEVAKMIPKAKLMIETDSPWCEIRKSHASYKYITAYPNKFYPEIKLKELEPSIEESNGKQEQGKQNQKLKQKQTPKPQIKLDEFLPFPTIKKEQFAKHQSAVETLAKQKNLENIAQPLGEFAYPLIRSRNETVFVGYVAEIMCELYGLKDPKEIENFVDSIYDNSCRLFQI
mmetsp:Transcript_5308/g.6055  ORF Transcript_5308/g.6055 Transcript_5308/m.6055 type:complete len:427 (+) Transcript_5308:435-1715(+)